MYGKNSNTNIREICKIRFYKWWVTNYHFLLLFFLFFSLPLFSWREREKEKGQNTVVQKVTVSIPPIINLTYVMFLIDFFLSLYPFLSLSFLNCTNPPLPPIEYFVLSAITTKISPLRAQVILNSFLLQPPN